MPGNHNKEIVDQMSNLTPALFLAWQFAATEASLTNHEYIEPQHLLLGIFKLESLSGPGARLMDLVSEENAQMASAEIAVLIDFFTRWDLDPVESRRDLRAVMALSGNEAINRQSGMVHRSSKSRQAFERASALAENESFPAITCLHVLAALIDTTESQCRDWLTGKGVDVVAMREDALAVTRSLQEGSGSPVGKVDSGSILSSYGKDLTELAGKGEIHQAIGRKDEILQVVRTLSRETKNNPLLIGDAGVGKTAIVEGLAWRIAKGDVIESVRDKRIVQINLADLVAGTQYRGDFEKRIQNLVREVSASPDVILFIDEIHTIVGAGRIGSGALDAANILKPALARGELHCIGATTVSEYRKYIEKDPAFERRFQPITVDEPTPEEAIEILTAIQSRFADRHHVSIEPDVIEAAVKLSVRYLPDRRLPDKAIDVLDEACARHKITRLTHVPDLPVVQGGEVTPDLVAEVISEWTGIPVTELTEDERDRLLQMGETLKESVIGQDRAVEAVAAAVQRARAGIKDPDRPLSVMLFVGPTGTGKTELAKATAKFLFGSEKAMTRLDMSEFMEKYSVSRLIGSPPGYVGYEEEGQLTGALKTKPFSVVVLDEVEKAHPDVLNLFLQVFDDGRLTDAKGRTVDASNALFIMTSNIGFAHGIGFLPYESNEAKEALSAALGANFRPEFINRIDQTVAFRPLDMDDLAKIARLMLDDFGERLNEKDMRLEATDDAVQALVNANFDERYGARPLRRGIERQVEDKLGLMILRGDAHGGQVYVLDAVNDSLEILPKEDRPAESPISQEFPRPK